MRLDGVSVVLGERRALDNVSFELEAGAFLGLIGPNGSGKSTMLRAILGILSLASGRIEVEGRTPAEAREAFAYLPQRREIELNLPLRALDVVMMGRLRHSGWLRSPSKRDKEIVAWALEQVGLMGRAGSSIGEMSFGQQQRVFFARTLAQQGRILLLDEPMNGVDPQTQGLFLDILRQSQREGRTIVMATHDLNQAAENCDRLCVLNSRLIAFGETHETLNEEVLTQAYGSHLHFMHGPQGAAHLDHVLEDVRHEETGP